MHDALHAGLIAAVVSGAPSTAIALARGDDVLEGARAAGTLLLPRETPHAAAARRRRAGRTSRSRSAGRSCSSARSRAGASRSAALLGGLAIAALDLGLIGRRLPRIRALPQPRQWADHAAYGLAVGRRARAAGAGAYTRRRRCQS